jgi:hypothetical protein
MSCPLRRYGNLGFVDAGLPIFFLLSNRWLRPWPGQKWPPQHRACVCGGNSSSFPISDVVGWVVCGARYRATRFFFGDPPLPGSFGLS